MKPAANAPEQQKCTIAKKPRSQERRKPVASYRASPGFLAIEIPTELTKRYEVPLALGAYLAFRWLLLVIQLPLRTPDVVLALPWNLEPELTDQLSYIADWGGQLVFPLPTLHTAKIGSVRR